MSDTNLDWLFYSGMSTAEIDEVLNPTDPKFGQQTLGPDRWGRMPGDPNYGVDLTPDDTGEGNQSAQQFNEDAFARMSAFLKAARLEGLEANLKDIITRGIEDSSAVLYELRNTEPYKKRFAANARREAKGLPALSPDTYIQMEQQYMELMRANGMPPGFYDSQDDFQKFLENDVSASELQSRIQDGYRAVADADPAVKQQMQRLYNVDDSQLAAYFLDPERATPLIQRQAQAAKIAARAQEQAGFTITSQTAEDLVRRGISPEAAQQAFESAGAMAGLYTEMAGETALTQEQKVGAALGYDVQAQQELIRRRGLRTAQFEGGGQFATTGGVTAGARETGLGTAQ